MVESQKVTLNDALIRNNLNNFILKTRLISTDLVATKRNLADPLAGFRWEFQTIETFNVPTKKAG